MLLIKLKIFFFLFLFYFMINIRIYKIIWDSDWTTNGFEVP